MSKRWSELRPCKHWERGYPPTHEEPGEPDGCGDPAHCSVHWKEYIEEQRRQEHFYGKVVVNGKIIKRVFMPVVTCPKCKKEAVVEDYAFDESKEEIVANGLCVDCFTEDEE